MTDINTDAQSSGPPSPDPALQRLDPLVGTWSMKGHFVGSDEEHITGQATFHWLDRGVFLQQDVAIDLGGTIRVKSRELIGYDPETQAFSSYVYSNLFPTPLPYRWDLRDGTLTISTAASSRCR